MVDMIFMNYFSGLEKKPLIGRIEPVCAEPAMFYSVELPLTMPNRFG
jgi:hypothetical protein